MYNWFEKQFAKHRRKMQTGEGGFTLVEMLVVIAILGILGGVGTVGYQGYAAHAREKADKELIATVNSAFASACLESRIDVPTVTEATVSVLDQTVRGLSTVTATGADINTIASAFDRYFAGNENSTFSTENVNSLVWNTTEGTFEISAAATALRITLSNGKTLVISAEDVALIRESTYADMGYEGVKNTVNRLKKSSGILTTIGNYVGSVGNSLNQALFSNGLAVSAEAAGNYSDNQKINGLQMVTAKYLAGADEDDIQYLLGLNLGNNQGEFASNLATSDAGGTRTTAATALQYALVEGFANSDASSSTTISYSESVYKGPMPWDWEEVTYTYSVEEFLATDYAEEDPIRAMAMVKQTPGYQSYAAEGGQGRKDIDGFIGTMSILGDNIGEVGNNGANEGAVEIDGEDGYLNKGIESSAAQEALTEILGSGN